MPKPLLQLYEGPPLAVKVVLLPLQIAIVDGLTEAVSKGLTVTKRLAVAEQLAALVTVTV